MITEVMIHLVFPIVSNCELPSRSFPLQLIGKSSSATFEFVSERVTPEMTMVVSFLCE